MTLGLFTSAIPIIDSTKMALFFGASIAVGIAYTFVPWLYEDSEDDDDFEELDVRITQTTNDSEIEEASSSTQIQIITHRRRTVRYDPEIDVHHLSAQSKTSSDKTSSEKSTQFLSINVPTGFYDDTKIQLCPQTIICSHNNQHLNMIDPHQTNYIAYKNNQNVFQDTYKLNNYQKSLSKKTNIEMNTNHLQKISKPPRAHPPSGTKSLKKDNGCQSPPLLSEKSFADVQTQTIDISKYQTQSSRSLNHPQHSEKISKLKESSRGININEIHERSLYPEVNVIAHGNEPSTFPCSLTANIDQGCDYSLKNQKTINNIENASRKSSKQKNVKFVGDKKFSSSSESYRSSYEQSANSKMESSSFVNRCKRILSFHRSEKDLVKSKSSISSAIGQVPSGHSTPIERSSDLSEEHQGYSSDAFGNESKQKHQLNKSGNLSRRPKVLLMARGIPTCVIQDLNLIHEKSNNKFITSRIISETLTSSNHTKNQSQHGEHNSGIENHNFTTTGSNDDINDNNNNYNNGWISRLSKDMHQVIGGIRKYIKLPKLNGNYQPSNKNSVNKDMNNNNNNNSNHDDDYYDNNIDNKYNNESSINYSSWKFKSSSTLNKSHSLTFLKTEINSNKKYSSLPELKDRRFFSRWSNFLPC